jgi:hypothetical protein
MPNGEWRGNVSMPLNEFTVELRSGNHANTLPVAAETGAVVRPRKIE